MTNIRIDTSVVENALSQLKQASLSLEGNFLKQADENVLNMVKKLDEINKTLNEVLTSYRELLLQNESATKESINEMVNTDELLATKYTVMK